MAIVCHADILFFTIRLYSFSTIAFVSGTIKERFLHLFLRAHFPSCWTHSLSLHQQSENTKIYFVFLSCSFHLRFYMSHILCTYSVTKRSLLSRTQHQFLFFTKTPTHLNKKNKEYFLKRKRTLNRLEFLFSSFFCPHADLQV